MAFQWRSNSDTISLQQRWDSPAQLQQMTCIHPSTADLCDMSFPTANGFFCLVLQFIESAQFKIRHELQLQCQTKQLTHCTRTAHSLLAHSFSRRMWRSLARTRVASGAAGTRFSALQSLKTRDNGKWRTQCSHASTQGADVGDESKKEPQQTLLSNTLNTQGLFLGGSYLRPEWASTV